MEDSDQRYFILFYFNQKIQIMLIVVEYIRNPWMSPSFGKAVFEEVRNGR